MAEPLIELKGVSKAFGDQVILDNVDLKLYPGEAVGIIGPSGTGKSTVLRIISGLLTPDEGDIYVQGVRRQGLIEDAPDPIGIGMVFQQAALFDSLTVSENVGFLLYQHSHLPPDKIEQLVNQRLETVGLPGIGDRFPDQLSGGMRKRVSFARAIMANPENPQDCPGLLLYDEPTAGLDPIASTVIEDLIRSLQRDTLGCGTYIVVTHQESTIRRATDRIVFLYGGKVQWLGSSAEMDATENPLIRQFLNGQITGPIQVVGVRA